MLIEGVSGLYETRDPDAFVYLGHVGHEKHMDGYPYIEEGSGTYKVAIPSVKEEPTDLSSKANRKGLIPTDVVEDRRTKFLILSINILRFNYLWNGKEASRKSLYDFDFMASFFARAREHWKVVKETGSYPEYNEPLTMDPMFSWQSALPFVRVASFLLATEAHREPRMQVQHVCDMTGGIVIPVAEETYLPAEPKKGAHWFLYHGTSHPNSFRDSVVYRVARDVNVSPSIVRQVFYFTGLHIGRTFLDAVHSGLWDFQILIPHVATFIAKIRTYRRKIGAQLQPSWKFEWSAAKMGSMKAYLNEDEAWKHATDQKDREEILDDSEREDSAEAKDE